jgi:hypothetical protein
MITDGTRVIACGYAVDGVPLPGGGLVHANTIGGSSTASVRLGGRIGMRCCQRSQKRTQAISPVANMACSCRVRRRGHPEHPKRAVTSANAEAS